MLRRSQRHLKSQHERWRDRVRNSEHRYREVNRWQRQATGTAPSNGLPGRLGNKAYRFNPEGALNTKGTSKFAWKWWYTQQPFLPNVAPEGYRPPQPAGQRPAAWDDAFTASVCSLTDTQLKDRIVERLTVVIFEESQRDGYELRKLDFEGRPLETLPEKRIIEQFVFEEETLRDRVLSQVVETDFRLAIRSSDREELKTVENIIHFITAHVTAARTPTSLEVTDAVKAVLAAQVIQPVLGFQHALPKDNRNQLVIEWERMHQLDWQFGKAVYSPRSQEVKNGNFEWLRSERETARRSTFDEAVASGKALAAHKAKIAAAASQ